MDFTLDTSQADDLPPISDFALTLMVNKGEGTLPYAFYHAFHEYRDANPVEEFHGEAETYFRSLREHMRDAMTAWLDEHDGKVDRWPDPNTGYRGIVETTTRGADITDVVAKEEFYFTLFGPGFTDVKGYRVPQKPGKYNRNTDDYTAKYWADFRRRDDQCRSRAAKLEADRNTAEKVRSRTRITPLRAIILFVLWFLGLNALVGFVYAFTGLFDYEHLVDLLGGLAHNGGPIGYLVWPVYGLQAMSWFIFKFVNLKNAGDFFVVLLLLAMAIGYYSVLWLFTRMTLHENPTGRELTGKQARKILRDHPEKERAVKALREELDREEIRLKDALHKDPEYLRCREQDRETTQQREKTYQDKMAVWREKNRRPERHLEMMKAYYRYAVSRELTSETVNDSDWKIDKTWFI